MTTTKIEKPGKCYSCRESGITITHKADCAIGKVILYFVGRRDQNKGNNKTKGAGK